MNKVELFHAVAQIFQLAGPLVSGGILGLLHKKYALPKMTEFLQERAWLLYSPLNVAMNIVFILVTLGVAVASHESNVAATLAWAAAHPSAMPVALSPELLRIAFYASTFLCGHALGAFPTEPPEPMERTAASPLGARAKGSS
ncbi:hypothetical protein KRR26_06900 [Corallococcus sp. M34]|uniref:hypothetical protein n=1 Tax=Citreicoccus inhibens TaxID=2849499 RepID=UPI001C21A552|nr:hypothetical protein [Citreicoccus inhibens]MBU8895326.1 hypothetical protein [Citreicoccus inhibens]